MKLVTKIATIATLASFMFAGMNVTWGNNYSDDGGETVKKSSGCGSSAACYTGRYSYNSANSDGGVIGPFTGSSYRIFVDKGGTSTIDNSSALTVGGLNSFKYYSKEGSSFSLGDVDNFTVGFGGNFDCDN